jgi:exonuclease SbcC
MTRLEKEKPPIEQKLIEVPDLAKLRDCADSFEKAKKQKEALEQSSVNTQAKVAGTEMELSGVSQLLNAETKRIVKANKELAACTEKISATEKRLKKTVAPLVLTVGQEPEQLKKEINTAHEIFRDLSLNKKEHELRLESIGQQLMKNDELREESKRLKSSAAVYHELGTLLSADRFQDYMLRSSYRLLAREGSRYFEELTGGRYSFHFDADKDQFSVRDHANGDELRSVSTLSGGESFLASLALALALSQSIRDLSGERGAVALESLFLDEGFSTLDPETLSKVADALPALQKKGRLIGVITHVEALAEQLPSRVEIEKTPAGSRIVQSHATQTNLIVAASA